MSDTFDKRYLAELEQLLQAEAELRRQGTDLLDDPEYRALRERFIEGELTLDQLSERVDNLAMTRSDGSDDDEDDLEDEDDGADGASAGAGANGAASQGSDGSGDGGGGDGD